MCSVSSVCVKMRANIFSCLLALILSWNVTAEIIHEVVEEKNPASLPCPHPVDKATWSRETNGQKVDILTAGGEGDIRHNDPGRRFSSNADEFKSLYISRVTFSDTGRYFCNNEPAVDLTVIPSGTVRLQATERTSVTLSCPPGVGGSDVPTWTRDAGDIQQLEGFYVSPVDKTLTITDLQPGDSGLYYCDGKPAAYLTVTRGNKTPPATADPPSTARQTAAVTTAPTNPPSTEIIHEVVEEKNPASLPCPHPVDKATWSRETNGQKVDILTAFGEGDIRHNDPGRRFSSNADEFKSLYISRVTFSDTGRYFCNNEPAVDLTVIPSGTVRLQATERTSVTLSCPPGVGGSDVPTWTRDAGDIRPPKRFYVSPVDKTLTITDLQPGDSGLYYCDGKPAAYLTVTRGDKTPTTTAGPPTTTRQTTTTTTPSTADSDLWQTCVRTVIGILYLIIMIGITVTAWRKAQQIQKRLTTETEADV